MFPTQKIYFYFFPLQCGHRIKRQTQLRCWNKTKKTEGILEIQNWIPGLFLVFLLRLEWVFSAFSGSLEADMNTFWFVLWIYLDRFICIAFFFWTLFCHEQWGENLGAWPVPCEVNSVLFYLVKRGEAPQVVAFTSEEMKIRDFVKEMFEGHGAAQDIPTSFWILYIYTFTTRTGDLNGIFTQLERLKCGSFRQHFWRRFFSALDEDDDRAWMRISRRHWSQTRTTLRTCSHSAL